MTVWIDTPLWPAHDRHFCHVVSDTSYDELHDVAARAGLPPRAFDGDHYDVPEERWEDVVRAGATPTSGPDLVRRLNASGLRLRKRRRDRGVRRYLNHPFPNGPSHVDLVLSDEPIHEPQVFGAMVFLRDVHGHFAAVYSIRRDEWSSPGGWREPGESPAENAVREAYEETGLVVPATAVRPAGYERFTPLTSDNIIRPDAPYLQVYRTDLPDERPTITQGDDGVRETRWASPEEFAELCGHLFWWPLAARIFPELEA